MAKSIRLRSPRVEVFVFSLHEKSAEWIEDVSGGGGGGIHEEEERQGVEASHEDGLAKRVYRDYGRVKKKATGP